VKLTDAQAGQALDRVLKQFGQATKQSVRPLAQAIQALAAKLTGAQAGQALDSVLKQIFVLATIDPSARSRDRE